MGQEKECIIENNLIKDLIEMGYEYIPVKNELQLKENFRVQFEKLNHDKFETEPLTDAEFERLYTDITRQLNKETYPIYEAAEMLRQSYVFMRDNGSSVYLSFLSQDLDKNTYQVANQITVHTDGGKKNRFDVTLLINGLPLVQIELKRSKVEVTKAITQVDDYNKNSYRNLFYFTQLLICSNGERTVYAANIDTINIDTKSTQISYSEWMDEKNNPCEYAKLSNFTPKFLDRCFITKFIWNYEIILKDDKKILAMRPYQIYAAERICDQVSIKQNGYIWHTTGSGKTLTSWKTANLISKRFKEVEKILLVVDSKDLDIQMRREYENFSSYSYSEDEKTNTKKLVEKLKDNDTKLIVVTVQTLTSALRKSEELSSVKNKRIIFIVDEAHRSWYSTQKNTIKNFFTNANYYGFTGTPLIQGKNIGSDLPSTEEVFGKCLHAYTIRDAIRDQNVLGFDVDYYSSGLSEEDAKRLSEANLSEDDKDQIYHNPNRIAAISKNIISSIKVKTMNGEGSAILATDSIAAALKYYDEIRKQNPDLKVVTIFSAIDERTKSEDTEASYLSSSHKNDLERAIKDYNDIYETKYTIEDYDSYRTDVSLRMKMCYTQKIDLLIVVNMFLTGFDSKHIMCMYIDKNLKWHKLIQTISRANRLMDGKIRANIVVFRDLKKDFDDAFRLFSNGEGIDDIIARTYGDYVSQYKEAAAAVKSICDEPSKLLTYDENEISNFLAAFKTLKIAADRLTTFEQFQWSDIDDYLSHDEFDNYTGYAKEYANKESKKQSPSIDLDEFNFIITKIQTVVINYAYIINLLKHVKTHKELMDIKKVIVADFPEEDTSIDIKGMYIEAIDSIKPDEKGEINNADKQFHENFTKIETKKVTTTAEENHADKTQILQLYSDSKYGKTVKKCDISSCITEKNMAKKIGFVNTIKNVFDKLKTIR